jgi:general L-amino acid transport system permease protein
MSSDATAVARSPGGFVPRGPGWTVLRIADWLRRNLFNSVGNTLLTILVLGLFALVLPPFIGWAITHASVAGVSRASCSVGGACWTFVKVRFWGFFFGTYPPEERWRVIAAALLMVAFAVPAMRDRVRRRALWVVLLLTAFPALASLLLVGGVLGLPLVETYLWGGLMLNVVISFVTVAGSLPLGILLALGRRSRYPMIRLLSVGYIELWRGVPLLTVLFMSAVMLPLLVPGGASIDRLIRAMGALVLFNAAYMAEVVRGGLQGVPGGQVEAAYSVGLRWVHVQLFVVLPQALRIAVPSIINTVVDLFKDTTLVTIIALFDMLGAINQALKDPAWLGFAKEGYLFSAVVFFACCYAMSAYGRSMERRLAKGK